MTWARLDDSFYDHPKTLRVWRRRPDALGLHARALSWCAKHEQDGHLPAEIVAVMSPLQSDREEQVTVLIEEGLWHNNGEAFVVHDYLDYNLSRQEITERRKTDRERKRAARG